MNKARVVKLGTIKSVDADRREFFGVATTATKDRAGDIVEPTGARFATPTPLLWQHRHDEPIGDVYFNPPTAKGITFRATVASIGEPGRLRDRVDEAWSAIRSGLVRAVSIGFKPIADGVEQIAGGGLRFKAFEILELSAVTVPANPDCRISLMQQRNLQTTKGKTMQDWNPERDYGEGDIVRYAGKTWRANYTAPAGLRPCPIIWTEQAAEAMPPAAPLGSGAEFIRAIGIDDARLWGAQRFKERGGYA